VIRSAFAQAADENRRLFVGGTAGLLDEMRAEEIGAYRSLMEALEKRAAILDVLAQRLDPRRPFARVGEELEPGLRELALVGATYGIAHRTLGSVSLLGPLRMDYEKALRSVRAAAHELSRFVEDVYAEDL
jgi:heat-inducible transcriptional repressor